MSFSSPRPSRPHSREIGAPVGLNVVELPALTKKGAYRIRVEGLVDGLERAFKAKKAGRR